MTNFKIKEISEIISTSLFANSPVNLKKSLCSTFSYKKIENLLDFNIFTNLSTGIIFFHFKNHENNFFIKNWKIFKKTDFPIKLIQENKSSILRMLKICYLKKEKNKNDFYDNFEEDFKVFYCFIKGILFDFLKEKQSNLLENFTLNNKIDNFENEINLISEICQIEIRIIEEKNCFLKVFGNFKKKIYFLLTKNQKLWLLKNDKMENFCLDKIPFRFCTNCK